MAKKSLVFHIVYLKYKSTLVFEELWKRPYDSDANYIQILRKVMKIYSVKDFNIYDNKKNKRALQ